LMKAGNCERHNWAPTLSGPITCPKCLSEELAARPLGVAEVEALARKHADKLEDAPGGPVDHPRHYNTNPSGVECITVVEHMGFNVGNAVKYLWRAGEKGSPIEDLKKARWYIEREISRWQGPTVFPAPRTDDSSYEACASSLGPRLVCVLEKGHRYEGPRCSGRNPLRAEQVAPTP